MSDRTLYLDCDVDKPLLDYFVEEVERLEAISHDPIVVVVSSFGGCCWTILGVLDVMERSACEFKTMAISKAMSAGAFLLAAGAKRGNRFIFPNATVMLHEPRGGANVSGYNGLMCMEGVREAFIERLMDTTGMSRDEILADIERDNYLSAEEAVARGYADHIIGADRGLDV